MKLNAPFTADQIMSLTEFQDAGYFHPFTCTTESCHSSELIPTRSGWVCPTCRHVQTWCYSWMANWEWKIEWNQLMEQLKLNGTQT